MFYVKKLNEVMKFNLYLLSQQVSLADIWEFCWHLPNANLKDTIRILCPNEWGVKRFQILPYPVALWIKNVRERKPEQKKKLLCNFTEITLCIFHTAYFRTLFPKNQTWSPSSIWFRGYFNFFLDLTLVNKRFFSYGYEFWCTHRTLTNGIKICKNFSSCSKM